MINTGAAPFSIVLLFENQANSLQVVQSLKDKGLHVEVVTSASDLIKMIVSRSLDLIGLSVNHSSTASLVKILKTRTHVSVLVFGEDTNEETTKAVLKTSADYQVSGAASSYNIWMKIGHMVREKEREQYKKSNKQTLKLKDDSDSTVLVKSNKTLSFNNNKDKNQDISVVKSLTKNDKENDKENDIKRTTTLSVKGSGKKLLGKKKEKIEKSQEPPEESIADKEALPVRNDQGKMDAEPEQSLSVSGEESKKKKNKLFSSNTEKKKTSPKHDESMLQKKKVLTEDDILDNEIGEIENLFFEESSRKSLVKPAVEIDAQGNGSVVMFAQDESAPEVSVSEEVEEASPEGDFSDLEQALMAELESEGKDKEAPLMPANNMDQEIEDIFNQHQGTQFQSHEIEAQEEKSTEEAKPKDIRPNEDASASEEDFAEEESSYANEADKIVSIEAARHKRKLRREKKAAEARAKEEAAGLDHSVEEYKKAFQKAMESAGEKQFNKLHEQNRMGQISKISIIPVDNDQEKGFILVADAQNEFISKDSLEQFKEVLSQEMKSRIDVELSLGDVFDVETPEVDMNAWASNYSQFSFVCYDENTNQEKMVCFLKRENLFPETEKIDNYEMHKVELNGIPARTPLNFDAYLYLERNEKMLPYLRRGGSFTDQQIDRLFKNGFKFLYIKDMAIRDYYAFHLMQYFCQDLGAEKKLA